MLIHCFRGKTNQDLNPQVALATANIIGNMLKNEGYNKILVGGDNRLSTPSLKHIIVSGFLSVGLDVYDYGLLPTPALSFLVKRSATPGVMVTASHNTPEWNGLEFMEEDSHVFGPEQEEIARSRLDSTSKNLSFCEWNQFGKVTQEDNAISLYIEELLKNVKMGNRKLKVVMDYGNGTACTVIPGICKSLNIEFVEINSDLDGNFPNRPSEPRAEYLDKLCKTVATEKADVGIAYDADADRCAIINEKGIPVDGDKIIYWLTTACYKPEEGPLVLQVGVSKTIENLLKRHGFEIIHSRVGQTFLGDAIKENGAVFAGEPNGHYIFPHLSLHADAIASTVYLCQFLSHQQKSISQLEEDFPEMYIMREKVDGKEDLLEYTVKIETYLRNHFEKFERLHPRLFVARSDDKKLVIRQSPFDSTIRIVAECEKKNDTQDLIKEVRKIFK